MSLFILFLRKFNSFFNRFAFITFENESDAAEAFKPQTQIGGEKVNVSYAFAQTGKKPVNATNENKKPATNESNKKPEANKTKQTPPPAKEKAKKKEKPTFGLCLNLFCL
jgi:RNA recognition motif-containing protein